jgi:hypothetical protein
MRAIELPQLKQGSPLEYRDHSCSDLEAEATRISRKSKALGDRVNQTAADDEAQMVIGLVLFWPALLFLEGEETADTKEYAEWAGKYDALELAAIQKKCDLKFQRLGPYPKKTDG